MKTSVKSPEQVTLTVFHGTSEYSANSIKENGLSVYSYHHVKRKCAALTTDLRIAELFATRRSGSDGFLKGLITGKVLEFTFSGKPYRDFVYAKDHGILQDEAEVAIFRPKILKLVAVHRCVDGMWVREPI